ncbi:MAG TPA: CBS domain-containing protein [Ktedonobacteraceae bacterium]
MPQNYFSKGKVRDVMTREVITVQEDQTKQQAARLLSEHHISGLPVVSDDNVLIGVVTEYDVIAREGQLVRNIMTRGVISVTEDTNLEDVNNILIHERIKRLFVLDQGKLIGVVSRADLVREVATRWVCPVCGEIMHSQLPPERCSRCDAEQIVILEQITPGF